MSGDGRVSGVRRLFVGGPWHGQVHELADDRQYWRVPEYGPMFEGSLSVATYGRHRLGGPTAQIAVMMDSGFKPYGDQFDREQATAAFLVAVGKALDVEVKTPDASH